MTMKEHDPKTWTERLEVAMTEKEMAEMGPRIDFAIKEVESLEEQKKAASDEFKAKIEIAEIAVKALRRQAANKTKQSDVAVKELFIERTFMVEVIRMDTGEKIRERAMTQAERNPSLPGLDSEPLTATIGEHAEVKESANDLEYEDPGADLEDVVLEHADSEDTLACCADVNGSPCRREYGHEGAHNRGDNRPTEITNPEEVVGDTAPSTPEAKRGRGRPKKTEH